MENKIAILYDFDDTLSSKCMQEFGLFENLGLTDNFFEESASEASKKGADRILNYLYNLGRMINKKGYKREDIVKFGKDIEFFPGVLTWFERINNFGKRHNIEVEHYIVSSGQKELIEGCPIAKYFKKIFACEYMYNEDGSVSWPKVFVNYTNKTQFIFRISKGVLDISDDSINDVMDQSLRSVSYENMIYVGDGYTDVPCMKVVKEKNGLALAVYTERNRDLVENLFLNGRVNNFHYADYSEGSDMEIEVKGFILRAEQKMNKKSNQWIFIQNFV